MTQRRDPHQDEDEGEKLDRQLLELLNELRVALPGVQVLFAFLLIVPFQNRFEMITGFQKDLYFVTLLLAAVSTALLIAPTAYHRAILHLHEKDRVIALGTKLAIAGLACLALAMIGAITLICDLLFSDTTAIVVAAGLVLVYGWFWFAMGALRRLRSQ